MKLKYIKTYQSVEFGKNRTQMNSFTAAEYHAPGLASTQPKVTLEEKTYGILVSNEDDCVLVGWANVAYARYDRSEPLKVAKAK